MMIVRSLPLPYGVRGLVAEDSDGNHNIYINARYSREAQTDALWHEIAHVERGHLHSPKKVWEIELEACDGAECQGAAHPCEWAGHGF